MGFKFSFLCDLLSGLEDNWTAKAITTAKNKPDIRTISQWVSQHEKRIQHPYTDKLALLSCIFPEKRVDRVYWLQATSLARVIGRCLGLGSSRLSALNAWREPGGPDLGQCVERVMRQAENHILPDREVMVEDIDEALNMIASRCRFSDPKVRRQHSAVGVEGALAHIYRRLSSRDAKWLTRMILKSYLPVSIPQNYTLQKIHFLLPYLLQLRDTFEGALKMLDETPMRSLPPRCDPGLAASLFQIASQHLWPQAGIKIGRPEYFKARSIKHCCKMSKGRRMSLERKYDGEYCQIHIDLTKQSTIQIFSKSGKDSTADRSGIIPTVEKALNTRTAKCKFTHRCILEGELLVWTAKHDKIADFHKLRKFLPRSGMYIGVHEDSPPQPYEHLMIVFFDILLLDDDVCLRKPHRQRRLLLQDVVQTMHGWADIAEQEILDFSRPDGQSRLEASFAKAIAQRWEGYLLKDCEEPYFPFYSAGTDSSFGRWIKLKKDYIPGLGDTLDLVVIGAYHDTRDASSLSSVRKLKWTHFLIGCLLNKDEVVQSEAVPRFKIVDAVGRHSMHISLVQTLNQMGEFQAQDPEGFDGFHVQYGNNGLSTAYVLFKKPFVVEMMGSGFDKPSGARYFTLRFPRVLKIHADRTFEHAASYQELQQLADEARSVPIEDLAEERENWRKRLKVGNGLNQYIVQRSRSPSLCSSSSDLEEHDVSSHSAIRVSDDIELSSNPGILHESGPRIPDHSQTNHSTDDVPEFYMDETVISQDLKTPMVNKNILTKNENLSSHNVRQKRYSKSATDGPDIRARPSALPSPSQVSAQKILPPKPGPPIPNSETPFDYMETLQSPLTTIPIYMPGTILSLEPSEDKESSSLREFIQSLGSDRSRSFL
ncbi:hypothetical protein N7495_001324 [Penicillium taxi]|uniref:uncharacterized protein n=1 Tax=Penicillium taxi TaxID=168475 RepID=UPI0025459B43|nr:uncharacterized protein N7495_001324 [Penicillium taxi]KAJ5908642.1 hypothetical protein N7495_001324 [Penicillium taxi]